MNNDNVEVNHQKSPAKGKRQSKFRTGISIAAGLVATRGVGKMMPFIYLGGVIAAASSLMIGNMVVRACGNWSVDGQSSDGLPNPNWATDWGYNWNWSWSIFGAYGSYFGSAHVEHTIAGDNNDQTTGLHSASGWQQTKVQPWNSGGTGHHGPPGDAKVTGQGDGVVYGSIHMDANNASLTSGSCAAFAYAEVAFSGVATGTCKVNLDGTYKEGDTTISGTLSTSGDSSVAITTTCGADVADANAGNTVSITSDFTGMIAGKLQKGFGVVMINARANRGAFEATAEANANIRGRSLSIDFGGNEGPCSELCPARHTH